MSTEGPDRRAGSPSGPHDITARSENLVAAAREAGVDDPAVIDAVRAVPRAAFVPVDYAAAADADEPIPIPRHQVTTQPSLSARMVQALRLTGREHVLEIGTGHGYQTALLARLAASVVSVERWPDLVDQARRNLTAHGYGNVMVLTGDGTEGAPEQAPYDAVLVSAAFPDVPPPLAEQLRQGGRLVQPMGPGGAETVTLFARTGTGLTRREQVTSARFVQLHGRYGYR